MAYVACDAMFPSEPHTVSGMPTTSAYLLDAAGEKAAVILQAPKTGSIRKVHFRTLTVTTGDTVDVRLETVDATTGFPSGTLFGTTTNAAVVINAADDNVAKTATLTADASVTRGDVLAVVIVNGSTPGNLNIQGTNDETNNLFPYSALYTTSWTANNNPLCITLEYSDGSFAHHAGMFPSALPTFTSPSSSTTPDEVGNIWTPAFDCKVKGCWIWVDRDGDCDIVLYDTNGTSTLASVSLDKDVRGLTSGQLGFHLFSSDVTLAAGSSYRLVVKPTSTTALNVAEFSSFPSVDALAGYLGTATCYKTSRTDAGAWTETNTSFVCMGFWLSEIDDGTGSGGGGGGPLIGGRLVG